jgi:hypothetical protein
MASLVGLLGFSLASAVARLWQGKWWDYGGLSLISGVVSTCAFEIPEVVRACINPGIDPSTGDSASIPQVRVAAYALCFLTAAAMAMVGACAGKPEQC